MNRTIREIVLFRGSDQVGTARFQVTQRVDEVVDRSDHLITVARRVRVHPIKLKYLLHLPARIN